MNSLERQARNIWNTRTKIPHSLGSLEDIAVLFCKVQNTLSPDIQKPTLVLAASNQGISKTGVTSSDTKVTKQMFNLFKDGNGTCAVLAKNNDVDQVFVDVGINKPSNDFSKCDAIDKKEVNLLINKGITRALSLSKKGCNTVLLGEMGIGNTTSSGAVMTLLTGLDSKYCVSGNPNKEVLQKKSQIIRLAKEHFKTQYDVYDVSCYCGAKEIVFLAGLVIGAYKNHMVVISDGFNTDVAVLTATKIVPESINNVVFSHCNGQICHKKLQKFLFAKPVMDISMCLGEGSGALVCVPLVKQSLKLFTDLVSFKKSGVECDAKSKSLPFALGTSSYVIPKGIRQNVRFLKDKVDDIELVLFESKNQSNIPDKKLIDYLNKTALKNNLSYTVHLPYDVKAASRNTDERKKAVKTWINTVKATQSLPVHGFIVHLEPDDYQNEQPSKEINKWHEAAKKSLEELNCNLPEGFDRSLICIETLGYDLCPYLNDILKYGFSVCLDVGHLFRFGFYSKEYVSKLLPYTRIIHLHGVDKNFKDHVSLTKHRDKKQLDEFLNLLYDWERQPIVLTLEIFSQSDFNESVRYLESKEVVHA